ncbi:MAG TPA: delta-60 repeat domain-containing protein, partial [Sporichthyaceae bacterium]|nr:delta-60 repeat domain-containing protein [Sporichthyaceae bacterium]
GVGDGIRGLVVLPDDRIVAAGAAGPDSAIVRYRADGSLDPTFGTRGVVLTRAGLADHFFDLAVDRVGRYVAVGTANSDFLVARYDANGEPDESFADHGRATTGFDAGQSDLAFHVELDDDGAIIAAGETGAVDPVGFTASRFALARYRPDGTLDTQFGRGGKVATDIASGPGAAADGIRGAVLRAGKLTVAGFCGEAHGITSFLDPLVGQFCVARYDAVSGRLDSGFGSGGVIVIDFPGGGAGARAIVMAPSGALTVVGGAAAPTTLAFAIARYPREGTQTTGAGGT